MASSVTTSLPAWCSGSTYDANQGADLRNSTVTPMWVNEGIMNDGAAQILGGVTGGAGLLTSPGGGMTVSVQPGAFVVPVTGSPVSGGYQAMLPQQTQLDVQAADPTNPRIDLVVCYVQDNGDGTSAGYVEVIPGTAAATPSAPDVPANSITIAQLNIPANLTTVASGNIADTRPFTSAVGGVLVAPYGKITGYEGMLAFDKATRRFYHNSNLYGGAAQASVLPFKAVQSTVTGNTSIGNSNATVTLVSCTFTCDGKTDIKITASDCGTAITGGESSGWWVTKRIFLDSAIAISYNTARNAQSGTSYAIGGGTTVVYSGSGGVIATPSAGTHTVSYRMAEWGDLPSGYNAYIIAPITLRVEPVVL